MISDKKSYIYEIYTDSERDKVKQNIVNLEIFKK